MRTLRTLWRLGLALAPVLAVTTACSPRPPPAPAPPPPPPTAPAPAPAPPEAPPPAPAAPSTPLTDRVRDSTLFSVWRSHHPREIENFESFLVTQRVASVVPTYQLLRSASMWKECKSEPFELPPTDQWGKVRDVLVLLRELRDRGILPQVEVVSAYRDPRLNRCAGGAPASSHQQFAVDIAPLSHEEGKRLCRFWREEGRRWNMGVSQYPSGRIHIDRTGYRTWGANHRRGSSYCLAN